ncbi:hypothetical protein Tco_0694135 [Tanacetum coccineum]
MEKAEKQPESKYTIRSSDKTALAEFDMKKSLFDSMHASKSFNKTPKTKRPDDAGKDEGPSTGSDRWLKRQKKSAQAEEILFEDGDTQGPQNHREDTGITDEPPVVNVDPKNWFKKPERPPTPDRERNKGKSVENKPTQKWLSNLVMTSNNIYFITSLIPCN